MRVQYKWFRLICCCLCAVWPFIQHVGRYQSLSTFPLAFSKNNCHEVAIWSKGFCNWILVADQTALKSFCFVSILTTCLYISLICSKKGRKRCLKVSFSWRIYKPDRSSYLSYICLIFLMGRSPFAPIWKTFSPGIASVVIYFRNVKVR